MKLITVQILVACVLGAALSTTACAEQSSASQAPPQTSTSAAAPSNKEVDVVVTLSDTRPMSDVVADLKAHGLKVGRQMDAIHVVSGRVSQDGMATLKTVSGVSAVELDIENQMTTQ